MARTNEVCEPMNEVDVALNLLQIEVNRADSLRNALYEKLARVLGDNPPMGVKEQPRRATGTPLAEEIMGTTYQLEDILDELFALLDRIQL